MSAPTTDTSVTMTIVVEAPIEKTFRVFTDGMGPGGTPSTTSCRPT